MGTRQCEVWAVHKEFTGRLKDRLRHHHAKHVCVRERNFGQEHEGNHRCSCGLTYEKSATDND